MMTDLCVLEPDPDTKEFVVMSLHPGVTQEAARAACGWPLRFSPTVAETTPPSSEELRVLRELYTRTAKAHGANA
jgi:glutaconate CoA-transferase subunit B